MLETGSLLPLLHPSPLKCLQDIIKIGTLGSSPLFRSVVMKSTVPSRVCSLLLHWFLHQNENIDVIQQIRTLLRHSALDLSLFIHDLRFVTFVIKVFGSDTEFKTALYDDAFIAALHLPLTQKNEKQDTAGNHLQ